MNRKPTKKSPSELFAELKTLNYLMMAAIVILVLGLFAVIELAVHAK